jgi:choline dehydrogenase-like flavoprotein
VVVLVLEAGIHHGPTPEIDIPGRRSSMSFDCAAVVVAKCADPDYRWLAGYMGRTIANPKFDWTFFSVPQKRANNRVVLQPRGKGLGGSSMVSTHCGFLRFYASLFLLYRYNFYAPTNEVCRTISWASSDRPRTSWTQSKS